MSSTYRVSIASFEGPFDLLLHLIARHKVDIYEIPLAQITDDYLAVLRDLREPDLEVTTEFLVVAATLIELKAARLLPGEDDPELEEQALEARDILYARLLDYRTFKEAAAHLRERLAAHVGYVPRAAGPDEAFRQLTPPAEIPVTAEELAELAARVLAELPDRVYTAHLQPIRMTVREAAGMLADELARAEGRATFAELTAGCRHRIEVVVCFLAVLELYKLECVELDQAANFGALTVEWLEAAPATALLEMDVYEGHREARESGSPDAAPEPAEERGE
jgi:segregation and condensation protein A